MDKTELGSKIQTLRKECGVSTYKLRQVGVHADTPKSIEKATKNYTIDVLIDYLEKSGLELEVKIKALE